MNTIEFRKTECEEWMLEYGAGFGVAVMIDGEDLNDKLARCNTKGTYDPGHQNAIRLWGNLHDALIPGTYDYECGAFICCCKSCGDECCNGTDVRVHEDELYVYPKSLAVRYLASIQDNAVKDDPEYKKLLEEIEERKADFWDRFYDDDWTEK